MNQRQWRPLVGENRSRGNLAVGSGCLGLDHKIMEICAGKKMYRTTNCWRKRRRHRVCAKDGPRSRHTKKDCPWGGKGRKTHVRGMMVRKAIKVGLANDWSELVL